jgi:hypothetical protein
MKSGRRKRIKNKYYYEEKKAKSRRGRKEGEKTA